jgi:plastocyanin
MKRKRRTGIVIAGLALAGIFTGPASAHFPQATVTIRHQMRGCHAWSFNGSAYKPSLKITVARGTTLKVIDNDVMPHKLVQLSGPRAKLFSPAMKHMAAQAKVVFPKKGTYRFMTKAGEDYPNMSMMKTIGEDNVLRLVVVVS